MNTNYNITTTLYISDADITYYNNMIQSDEVDYEAYDIQPYSTVQSWTTNFGNGYEVDIKVCSSEDGEPLWAEGVLFLNGCEVTCTDVQYELDGVYEFEYNGDRFTVDVRGSKK